MGSFGAFKVLDFEKSVGVMCLRLGYLLNCRCEQKLVYNLVMILVGLRNSQVLELKPLSTHRMLINPWHCCVHICILLSFSTMSVWGKHKVLIYFYSLYFVNSFSQMTVQENKKEKLWWCLRLKVRGGGGDTFIPFEKPHLCHIPVFISPNI